MATERSVIQWVDRDCPLCRSQESSVVWKTSTFDEGKLNDFAFSSRKLPEYMHPQMMLCMECELLYSSPAPDLSTVTAGYEEASYDSGVEAQYASRTYASIVQKLGGSLVDRNRALDIGAGDGAFLERLLEMNFTNVTGVEPSRAPIEAARPLVRPRLKQALFDPNDFEPDSFSLVTCFQTIEHLHDPLGFCESAYKILKPGGILLLVGHNRLAATNRAMGTSSPIFDIEHLQLFSPISAKTLLKRAGFHQIVVQPIVNDYPLRYLARLAPVPACIKSALLHTLSHSKIGDTLVTLPLGNIAFYGIKP